MIQSTKKIILFLFTAILFSILVQYTKATVTNFTVPRGEEFTKSIDLTVDDHVSIKFTVVGQTNSTLNFYVTDPHGSIKAKYDKVGNLDYPFVCDEAGEYTLHFDNTDMTEDKFVTLNYEIQHYIFGMPQMLFFTIIIVLVCIGAVATFILMGKTF